MKINPNKELTRLDYIKYWLILTAVFVAADIPFIVFLHFFKNNWFELLFLTTFLSSFWVLVIYEAKKKQK